MNQYVLYAILSGCLAGTNGMLGRILTEGGMSSTEIGACRFAITTVLYFVISIRVGAFVLKIRWKNLWIFLGTGAVGQLLYSTLFFTAVNIMPIFVVSTISITCLFIGVMVGYVSSHLYLKALTKLDAGKASILTFSLPTVAAILGILFYREPVTLWHVAGVSLILAAMQILSRKPPVTAYE